MNDPITFTSDEVNFIADEDFFKAKARISVKVRQTLETLHHVLREELNGKDLIVPEGFDPNVFQFVKKVRTWKIFLTNTWIFLGILPEKKSTRSVPFLVLVRAPRRVCVDSRRRSRATV